MRFLLSVLPSVGLLQRELLGIHMVLRVFNILPEGARGTTSKSPYTWEVVKCGSRA